MSGNSTSQTNHATRVPSLAVNDKPVPSLLHQPPSAPSVKPAVAPTENAPHTSSTKGNDSSQAPADGARAMAKDGSASTTDPASLGTKARSLWGSLSRGGEAAERATKSGVFGPKRAREAPPPAYVGGRGSVARSAEESLGLKDETDGFNAQAFKFWH